MLVVTGGFLHLGERSPTRALRREAAHWRRAGRVWYDLKVKLVSAEPVVLARRHMRRAPPEARALLSGDDEPAVPELTEVLLATLLAAEGLEYELASVDDVFAGRAGARLERTDAVFLSSTMLRDLAEVEAVVDRLGRKERRIVVGGALASAIHVVFPGLAGVDVLAVGEGEALVPTLASWLRGGELRAPAGGSVEQRGPTAVVRAPPPPSLTLDTLPAPDWRRSARDRGVRYRSVHYESVRGCPYRCAFCNYPYLFADDKFRVRSSRQMADDWERFAADGVEHVNCLDSLFTMPKRRLVEFCNELLRREVRLQWTCYARADDLADPATVRLMREAGARVVHIGIESGDQGQLDRMAKRGSVESNAAALRNCRAQGLTTFATLIIGFPGETPESVERTFDFLRANPPDFHFSTALNTRIEAVPVLSPESRALFGLVTERNPRSTAPAWRHATMDCVEAMNRVRELDARLALEEVSLNAATFYAAFRAYTPADRAPLLRFQREAYERHPTTRRVLSRLNRLVDARAKRIVGALA